MQISNHVRHMPLFGVALISMTEGGVWYTVQQLQNRWKNLKKTYLSVIDHNSKTGAIHKTCKLFAEFNEIYGTKASTCPEATRELGVASCSTNNDTDSEPCPNEVKRFTNATTQIFESINQHSVRHADFQSCKAMPIFGMALISA